MKPIENKLIHYEGFDRLVKYLIDLNLIEMTIEDIGFLKNLCSFYKPRNILEIGVFRGGSSIVLLDLFEANKLEYEMISMDLNHQNDSDSTFKLLNRKIRTGYLIEEYLSKPLKYGNHKLKLGKFSVEYFEKIAEKIDFLLIDTVHFLPGEVLDFLAYLPKLKDGCVVVLHDIGLNNSSKNAYIRSYATKLLLDVVNAKKFPKFNDDNEMLNIGGFIVDIHTRQNVGDLFSLMSIDWEYDLTESEFKLYFDHFSKYYGYALSKEFSYYYNLHKKKPYNSNYSYYRLKNRSILGVTVPIGIFIKRQLIIIVTKILSWFN